MTSEKEDLPSAVVVSAEGSFPKTVSGPEATRIFTEFLAEVTRDCAAAGATMIGHVKANIRSEGEMMSISSTTEDGNVRKRSVFEKDVKGYRMTVNVIVYGIDENTITRMIKKREIMLGTVKMEISSETQCNDPECDDPDCGDPAHRIIRIE